MGFWKLNFRIGGRKPPNITPWFRTPCQRSSEPGVSGRLRPLILKLSFQVGDVCVILWVLSTLPLNGGFWPMGLWPMGSGGLCPVTIILWHQRANTVGYQVSGIPFTKKKHNMQLYYLLVMKVSGRRQWDCRGRYAHRRITGIWQQS